MRKTPSCLICHSTNHQVILNYDQPDPYERRVGVTEDGYWRQWVRCTACGFHYSLYSRPNDLLDRLYETGYRDASASWRSVTAEETFHHVAALPDDKSESVFRTRWIKKRIEELMQAGLLRWNAPPYRMLDIGGATGIFAYKFQDDQWQTHVVDPSREASFIESSLSISLIQKPYSPNLFGYPFELISMVFVLEHLLAPNEALLQAKKDLAEDGLLYIEVPDALAFRHKDPEDDIFNACHLWMFDPGAMIRLLDWCGLQVYTLFRTQTMRGHFSLMVLAGRR